MSLVSSSWYLSARHPVTMSFFRRASLSLAIWSMVSTDSSLAAFIKPQVLIMSTSAASGSWQKEAPHWASLPSIFSESTRFLVHPRLIRATFGFFISSQSLQGFPLVSPCPPWAWISTPRASGAPPCTPPLCLLQVYHPLPSGP